MSFLKRLLARQRLWLAGTVTAVISMLAAGWMLDAMGDDIIPPSFTSDMTIREIAPQLGTTGFAMAKEMHLPRSVDKDMPLSQLGIDRQQLDEVAEHLQSHQGRAFKYCVFAALSLFGLVWLTQLGPPDRSTSLRSYGCRKNAGTRNCRPPGVSKHHTEIDFTRVKRVAVLSVHIDLKQPGVAECDSLVSPLSNHVPPVVRRPHVTCLLRTTESGLEKAEFDGRGRPSYISFVKR